MLGDPDPLLALELLLDLAVTLDEPRYREAWDLAAWGLEREVGRAPHGFPQLAAILARGAAPPMQAVIVTDRDDGGAREPTPLLVAVMKRRIPGLVVLFAGPLVRSRVPAVAAMREIGGAASLYLCEGFVCRQPVSGPEAVESLLDRVDPLP